MILASASRTRSTTTCTIVGRAIVAQVANLPYRRLPVGRVSSTASTVADWKSAIQQAGNLRYGSSTAFVCEMSRPGVSRRWPTLLRVSLLLLALVFPAWKKVEARENSPSEDARRISALVTAEETLLTLSPKMSALSKGLLDLRLPGPGAEAVFAPSVNVSDVGPPPAMTTTRPDMLEARTWPVEKDTQEGTKVDLWRPLRDAVVWCDHA